MTGRRGPLQVDKVFVAKELTEEVVGQKIGTGGTWPQWASENGYLDKETKLGKSDTVWALQAYGDREAVSSGVSRPSGAHVMGWAAPWIEAHRGRCACSCVQPL